MSRAGTRETEACSLTISPLDNVAVIVNEGGLPAGTRLACGVELIEQVPQAHKVSLCDLEPGQAIVRYGEVIGYAARRIAQGSWVSETLVRLPSPPDLERLALATRPPAPLPPLSGYGFQGFRNPDGSAGTLNLLGITTTVQCVAGVIDVAVERIKSELLPAYPQVDGVVALKHPYGCGVAINAPDAAIPIRTIRNLATHPNFGGELLVVGLGCEKLLPEHLWPEAGREECIILQEQEGFGAMVRAIVSAAEQRLERLSRRRRVSCPLADLVIGLQCGGSDALSGVTANPAVGFAADLLVRAGATVLFSEVTEVRDAIHLLTPRAASPAVAQALIREMKWYDDYLKRGAADRSANPTPGNKEGGLANVVEKALGSIAKSGSSRIAEVIPPGEKVRQKGLVFAATPASDFVCGTLQLASGMHLQIFTTGRGTPYGLAMAPVLKVASRSALAARWSDLIDVDAGKIATGEASIEQAGWEIFRMVIEVASGRQQTRAQQWNLHNELCLFNPAPIT